MKVLILTQETCPNCDKQKMFMNAALGGKYDGVVTYIKREESPADFEFWVNTTETTQTPTTVFVKGGDIVETIIGFKPAKIKKAFETHIQ